MAGRFNDQEKRRVTPANLDQPSFARPVSCIDDWHVFDFVSMKSCVADQARRVRPAGVRDDDSELRHAHGDLESGGDRSRLLQVQGA